VKNYILQERLYRLSELYENSNALQVNVSPIYNCPQVKIFYLQKWVHCIVAILMAVGFVSVGICVVFVNVFHTGNIDKEEIKPTAKPTEVPKVLGPVTNSGDNPPVAYDEQTRIYKTITCERNTLEISCPVGATVNVTKAQYGRIDTHSCAQSHVRDCGNDGNAMTTVRNL